MATESALASRTFFDVGKHAAGPGPVAGERAVHHGKDPTMDSLLDHEQIDERLVNHRMRPVAALVEKAAKGVFHGARCSREDMGLHGRQMNDVLAEEALGDVKATRVDLVQAQEVPGEITHGIPNVDPLLAFVQVNVAQAVARDDIQLLLLPLAKMRVDHHRTVVAGMDALGGIAVASWRG